MNNDKQIGVTYVSEGTSVSSAFDANSVGNEEESDTAEDKVSPLVAALDEGSDETGNNHDLVDENGVDNGWSWETAGEEQVKEQKWCSDKPINVSNVENLSHVSGYLRIRSLELNLNSSPAQVGAHREVGNRSYHSNGGSDVVEDSLVLVLLERHSNEGTSSDNHDSTYCEIPVASSDCDVVVGEHCVSEAVLGESVVTLEDRHVDCRG